MKALLKLSKKLAIAVAVVTLAISVSSAQSTGDYRTANSGNWNNTSTWETYNGTSWATATAVPGASSGVVTIKHNVNVTDTQFMSTSLVIELGNELTVDSLGVFNMGSGVMTGYGDFTVSGGASLGIGHADGIHSAKDSGNIQIDGTVSLSSGGTYIFNGGNDQLTGNGLPATVRNLVIDNGFTVTMQDSITITNGAYLISGKLYTDSLDFIYLTYTASYYSALGKDTGTSASYVVGPTRMEYSDKANITKYFPFGTDSFYHPIKHTISHAKSTQNIYWFGVVSPSQSSGLIKGGSSIQAVHPDYNYFQQGYSITSAVLQQEITIYWFDYDGVSDLSKTAVAQFKNGYWDNITGSVTTYGDTTEGYIVFSNNSQDRRDFALASFDTSTNPVPVVLINFDAALVEEGVLLDWSTAQEINNSHFIVERSTDNANFEFVTEIGGMGNTTLRTDYSYLDMDAPKGTVYYRLTQVDYDGTEEMVGEDVVIVRESGSMILAPNPSKERLVVTLPDNGGTGVVTIIDMKGQEVYRKSVNTNENVRVEIDVTTLPKGFYHVIYSDGIENIHEVLNVL